MPCHKLVLAIQQTNKFRVRQVVVPSKIHQRQDSVPAAQMIQLQRRLFGANILVRCLQYMGEQLSKAIADADWGELVRQLQYKGEWAGRSMIAIDPFFPSSKRCSGCTLQKLLLNVRKWYCPQCGTDHDRDVNAARNIKAAGLAVLAHGATVNP